MATRPGGNFARSFSAAGIVPVSASATIFSCRVAPIPGSSFARPASASSATEVDASRTVFEAVRYATTRCTIAPSSSYRSPSSSKASAIAALVS